MNSQGIVYGRRKLKPKSKVNAKTAKSKPKPAKVQG